MRFFPPNKFAGMFIYALSIHIESLSFTLQKKKKKKCLSFHCAFVLSHPDNPNSYKYSFPWYLGVTSGLKRRISQIFYPFSILIGKNFSSFYIPIPFQT